MAVLESVPRRWKWFAVIGVVILVSDQVTKYWARHGLPTDSRGYGLPVPIIENFWDWRLSYNTGSAFGLFSSVDGARIFLTIVGFIALGAILWMVHKGSDDQRRLSAALGLVGGGAIGNVIDRLLYGAVVDFLDFHAFGWHWPAFNVADIGISCGAVLLVWDALAPKGPRVPQGERRPGV